MEETLTDCLVRMREDLSNLKRVRDYLNTNKGNEECCSVTWRTIEAFNSILGVCSSQHTPETNALDTLLDSFYYLARNNADPSVWNDFGFELGLICAKVLSAIERSEIFEALFCKLLTVINVICEHNPNVWKASARQILNVFINKKFSLSYFESVLKLYICILRNIDSFALHNFSSQNLHLLKTLSMLVQKIGDFEIQSDIMELVFLHLSRDTTSMSEFFATSEKKLFESLEFKNFEEDSRVYLNALNKPRGGLNRKVYSITCHVLYLGGCFVEPPVGSNSFWVDANKETRRLSIRCADSGSEGNRVIYILFSDIQQVELANEKTGGRRCLTIQTKSLWGLQFDVKNDEVCLMVENGEALLEFVNFLTLQIKRKNKMGRKISKTTESLFIDRSNIKEVQDNAVTSSEKRDMDHILPDIFNLFENGNKTAKTYDSPRTKITSPPRSQEQNVIPGSQELSPNSFVESLDKHIGRESQEVPHTFEDSVETVEFLQRTNPGGSHKLFRSPHKIFEMIKTEDPNNFSFIFDENKENKVEKVKPKRRTAEAKQKQSKPADTSTMVLRDRKNLEAKLANSQSQDYFRQNVNVSRKQKPSLPKLRRSSKAKTQKPGSKTAEQEGKKQANCVPEGKDNNNACRSSKETQKVIQQERQDNPTKLQEHPRKLREREKRIPTETRQILCKSFDGQNLEKQQQPRPSLLDPNGYAYRRWCEPTTSERGNFWLKKLKEMQKSKPDADSVFDFSESSDLDSSKMKKKKRKVVHSKRNHKTKETHQNSLKQVKEILKKASPKQKPEIRTLQSCHNLKPALKSPVVCQQPQQQDPPEIARQETPPESNHESELSDDENQPLTRPQKRDLSEDTPPIKTRGKKKQKTVFLSGNLLSVIRNRLLKKERKDQQQTDEIILAVNKGVSQLFNHFQKKDCEAVKSYLNTAEEAVAVVESEVEALSLRSLRIERAMMYFRCGCSVAGTCETLESQFSGVRSALRSLAKKKEVSATVSRVSDRLKDLLKSGIEKSIENELALRRNRLLKCASLLGESCGKFG